MEAKNTTIDNEEIAHFSRIADEWWSETGKFAPLHRMNPLRIEYIRDKILKHFQPPTPKPQTPLTGISLLDIGCGGGLISEPMARLGASVTAIDAGEKNINVAKLHAQKSWLDIDYRCESAEELSANNPQPLFDVILALEIIEHVADLELFIKAATALLKPNGLIILSTLNRTPKSYALAIIGAEYILRWLPIGTHTWKKFLRPSELVNLLENNNLDIREIMGMIFNPITKKWKLDARDLAVNYIVVATK